MEDGGVVGDSDHYSGMAQTDIKDTITAATGTVATSSANFIQTEPGGLNLGAGRGCAGAPGGEDKVVVDWSRPVDHTDN